MNKRIQELAEQAGVYFGEAHKDYFGEKHPAFIDASRIDVKKFAELLVKECIECVENTDKNMMFTADVAGHVGAAHNRSIRQIKQHFGVEE